MGWVLQNNKQPTDISIDHLNRKVDLLEQKSYSNVILCSGECLNEVFNEQQDSNQLVSKTVDRVKRIYPDVNVADIIKITPVGRNKKCLKVVCSSINIKKNILKEARERKLPDIFCTEFLTQTRNNIFFELRQLRKKYPHKFKSTYVRNGNIFYKLQGNESFSIVHSMSDVLALERSFLSDVQQD